MPDKLRVDRSVPPLAGKSAGQPAVKTFPPPADKSAEQHADKPAPSPDDKPVPPTPYEPRDSRSVLAQPNADPNKPTLVDDPESGLSLVWRDQVVRADFSSMLPRLRQGPLHKELLVRAAKLKGVPHPVAVDATAGLGEDSLLLAAAGFEVTLFERDSLIAALLRDAVLRARDNPTLAAAANRMHVIEGDSIAGLRNLEASPDVVFLDPMFPARTKSAAVKKKLQVIQLLEEPCDDEAQLVEAALAVRPRKVIIKRPIKGPHLAGLKPSYSLTGKAVRYDVLVPPR